ncbi:MAG TPA: ChaN family lipoprotein [Myxococcota bacterium]|nr:ChaN family lipoprotein [Myxococcota bacterium]
MGGAVLRHAVRPAAALAIALASAGSSVWLASACSSPAPAPTEDAWTSAIGRDHPLAGRIYDVAAGAELDERGLLEALSSATFVLLGESHENADHHRLQARLVAGLAARGEAPAVAFEMLRADQQAALDEAQAAEPPTADGVRAATHWEEGGWPDFALYAPIFEAALAAGLPLVAADLDEADRNRLASDGPLPPDLAARLGVEEPLPAALRAALERDLAAGHCGMLPASAMPRLVRVQRGRDAALAQALVEAPGAPPDDADPLAEEPIGVRAVLIAGAEHARRDRGAPRALARIAPGADVATVAFLEVDPGAKDLAADFAARYGGEAVFDYAWYTPKASDEDPCERMRKHQMR